MVIIRAPHCLPIPSAWQGWGNLNGVEMWLKLTCPQLALLLGTKSTQPRARYGCEGRSRISHMNAERSPEKQPDLPGTMPNAGVRPLCTWTYAHPQKHWACNKHCAASTCIILLKKNRDLGHSEVGNGEATPIACCVPITSISCSAPSQGDLYSSPSSCHFYYANRW